MLQYVIRRLLWSFVMIFLVTGVVFLIFFVLPGGTGRSEDGRASPVAVMMAGRNPRPELVANIEERLGLNKPVYVQFGRYVWNALQGDLGYSYQSQIDVREAVFHRLPATFGLAFGASIVWLLIGIPIGVISALKRRSLLDRGSMLFALAGVSMPTFWLGLICIFYFDSSLGIYSVGDYAPITENPGQWLATMWLPPSLLGIDDPAQLADTARRRTVLNRLLAAPRLEAMLAYVCERPDSAGSSLLYVEVVANDGRYAAEYPIRPGQGWHRRELVRVPHRRLQTAAIG